MSGLLLERVSQIVNRLCPDTVGEVEFEFNVPEVTSVHMTVQRNGPGELMTLSVVKELRERHHPEFLFEDFHLLQNPRDHLFRLKDYGFGKFTDFEDGNPPEAYWFGSVMTPPLRHQMKLPLTYNGEEFHPRYTPEKVRGVGLVWADDMLAHALLTAESHCSSPQSSAPEPPGF